MDKLTKKVYRSQAKVAYKKFCKGWAEEKKKEFEKSGRVVRRPTFREWLRLSEAFRRAKVNEGLDGSVETTPLSEEVVREIVEKVSSS